MASKSKIIAELFEADGDIVASALDNVVVTPTAVSDQANTSTGQFGIPSGTSAQRPGTSYSGAQRFNTDLGVMEYYNGTSWLKISSEIAVLNSVTGTIYAGVASTLTLAGTGFLTSDLVVNFLQSSDSINANVTVTPSSDTAATVAIPSTVYSNVTVGNVVLVKVTNSDLQSSSNISKTSVGFPSGGTITTVGDNRIHTFTSSSNLVVPTGFSTNADILVVAGGGGGGAAGGGGGAGGALTFTSQGLTAQTYAVAVGAGGAGASTGQRGSNGNNSRFGSLTTCIAGGGGGSGVGGADSTGENGGSGGGAGRDNGNLSVYGSGTSGQGNRGGGVGGTGGTGGGGGGGKGGAGVDDTNGNYSPYSQVQTNGGAGFANNYQTGSNQNYAGGGGGAMWGDQAAAAGVGGSSIGGNGAKASSNVNGGNATANTGSGGGGSAGGNTGGGTGGSGSGGIVIVKYDIGSL